MYALIPARVLPPCHGVTLQTGLIIYQCEIYQQANIYNKTQRWTPIIENSLTNRVCDLHDKGGALSWPGLFIVRTLDSSNYLRELNNEHQDRVYIINSRDIERSRKQWGI